MQKLTIIHGGGRGSFGPAAALFSAKEDVSLYVVEADFGSAGWERYANLSREQSEKMGLDVHLAPGCLWDEDGEPVDFHINVMPDSSSIFPRSTFAEDFKRESGNGHDTMVWKDVCEPVEIRQLQTVTIDTLLENGVLAKPDVISLDIQGAELQALAGAEGALDGAICILTEAEFLPLYEGQALIGDIMEFLSWRGFFLAGFTTTEQWYMGPIVGRGFPAVTESIFFREEQHLTAVQKMKLGFIAGVYGFKGHAYRLLDQVVKKEHDEWEIFLAQGGTLADLVRSTYLSIHKELNP